MVAEDGLDKSEMANGEKSPDAQGEIAEVSAESVASEQAASKELVSKLTAQAAELFNKLHTQGVEAGAQESELAVLGDELKAISQEMDGLLEAHDLDLQNLQKSLKDNNDLAKDMPEVFSPDDLAKMEAEIENKQAEKNRVQDVKNVAAKGAEKVKRHADAQKEAQSQKEKETQKRQSFVDGIDKSGFDKKIAADGLEVSYPEVVQKFAKDKLDVMPADKRAEITADVDKQIAELQTKIDDLSKEFKESDVLAEQRIKVEAIKDKFPDQYAKASALLDSKKQVEQDAFVEERSKDLLGKIQDLEASKKQAEIDFVKKEFGAELLDKAATDESVDLNKFAEGVAEKIDPKKLSLLEARRLPLEIISAVVDKVSGLQIAELEAAASPIIFTKEYSAKREEVLKEISKYFDADGRLKADVIKQHQAIIKEGEDTGDKKTANEKEIQLWQEVKDAVAIAYTRQGAKSPFEHYSLDVNERGMSVNNARSNAWKIRGEFESTAMVSLADGVRHYTKAESNQNKSKMEGLTSYAEQITATQEAVKPFAEMSFPSPYYANNVDEVDAKIKNELSFINQAAESLPKLLKDPQKNIDQNFIFEMTKKLEDVVKRIKSEVADYNRRTKEAAEAKDRQQKERDWNDKSQRARGEFAPTLEAVVEKVGKDAKGLTVKRDSYKSQVRGLDDARNVLAPIQKKYEDASKAAAEPMLGFFTRKVEVPVYDGDGKQAGTQKLDKAKIDQLLDGVKQKRAAILESKNTLLNDAQIALAADKQAALANVDSAIEQAKKKFENLNNLGVIDNLKHQRKLIEDLDLKLS